MKKERFLLLLLAVGCGFLLFPTQGFAQPSCTRPASILIFPYFSARDTDVTMITITNTNRDSSQPDPNGPLVGQVRLHMYYVNLIEGGGTPGNDDDVCEITNAWRLLEPADTFTVWVSAHIDTGKEGFLYVVAEDPETGAPIDFDYLIGEALIINPAANFMWATTAYGYRALCKNDDPGPGEISLGGHLFTEVEANGGVPDGVATFTGNLSLERHEYEAWPDELFLASFWEQTMTFSSFMVLLSPLSSNWRTRILTLYYNDSEVEFSQTRRIRCWIKQPLTYFMPGADDLPAGPGIEGASDFQIGWARIQTKEAVDTVAGGGEITHPPILGMIIRTVGGGGQYAPFQGANLLHHTGVLNDSNTNWDFAFNGGVEE